MPVAADAVPGLAHNWEHPHDGFRYGVMRLYEALYRGEDCAPLIFGLYAYVLGMSEPTKDWDFEARWEELQERIDRAGRSRTGIGGGLDPLTYRALEIELIVRGARKARLFEAAQPGYGARDFNERAARLAGGGAR